MHKGQLPYQHEGGTSNGVRLVCIILEVYHTDYRCVKD